MKKWMSYVLIAGLSAGTASAGWWPFGSNEKKTEIPEAPEVPKKPHMQNRGGEGGRMRDLLSPEQKEKMKAKREQLMKLGEAIRNETDPAKKESLIGELRAQLTEIADKMQAEGKKRLEQAEKDLSKLKERLADAEKNKAARIEEQIKRIIAGEPFRPHGDNHPGKPGEKPHKKEKPQPAAE
jgi:hypothetical protein